MSEKKSNVLDLCTGLPVAEIRLDRGDTGLGFNIRGGTDIPHFKDDSGIFVTKLKDTGAAFKDQRIKEGDKIVEINGVDLRSVTHNEAVQVFITAGETVSLKVQHGAEKFIIDLLESRAAKSSSSGRFPWCLFVIGLVAVTAAGVGVVLLKNK